MDWFSLKNCFILTLSFLQLFGQFKNKFTDNGMGDFSENSVLILRLNFIKCNHLRLPESSLSATLGCHVSLCFFFFFCLILWPQHVSWGMLSKLNALGPKIWRQDCRKNVAKNQEVHIRTMINVPI